jgi:hypothetical protein
MTAWILALLVGPVLLAGFAVYLCRGPRPSRHLARRQMAEFQVLASLESYEDLPGR